MSHNIRHFLRPADDELSPSSAPDPDTFTHVPNAISSSGCNAPKVAGQFLAWRCRQASAGGAPCKAVKNDPTFLLASMNSEGLGSDCHIW